MASNPPVYIDDMKGIESMLKLIVPMLGDKVKSENKALYMDLEGYKLGRDGTVSIVSIYVPWEDTVFVIDTFVLGKKTFYKAYQGYTLKSILESKDIPKGLWDTRNDSDGIYHNYRIFLRGVFDIQLLQLAISDNPAHQVLGLAKAISYYINTPSDITELKWKVKEMFAQEDNGGPRVFEQRPLTAEMLQYCSNDVAYLKQLADKFIPRIEKRRPYMFGLCTKTSWERVLVCKSPDWDPNSWFGKANSPWGRAGISRLREKYELQLQAEWDAAHPDRICDADTTDAEFAALFMKTCLSAKVH